jgi:hypothetical protein
MTNGSGYNPTLCNVWGASSTQVYAVGYSGSNGIGLYWNGSSWAGLIETPGGYTATFNSVWQGQTLFIVGYWQSVPAPLIYHWDTHSWTSMNPGTSDDVELFNVWGLSESNIYAVGNDNTTGAGAMLHYDGASWSPETIPSGTMALYGVWGSSETDVYAVGASTSSSKQGVVLHYGN